MISRESDIRESVAKETDSYKVPAISHQELSEFHSQKLAV